MKNTIHMAGTNFSAHRMLIDYAEKCYLPGLKAGEKLSADNFTQTKNVTNWLDRMSNSWDKIKIVDIDIPEMTGTLFVGQKFPLKIKVALGDITPDDIVVEIVAGKLNFQEQIPNYGPVKTNLIEKNPEGIYTFEGEVTCQESGRFGITARITPQNDILPHTIKPKLITWW